MILSVSSQTRSALRLWPHHSRARVFPDLRGADRHWHLPARRCQQPCCHVDIGACQRAGRIGRAVDRAEHPDGCLGQYSKPGIDLAASPDDRPETRIGSCGPHQVCQGCNSAAASRASAVINRPVASEEPAVPVAAACAKTSQAHDHTASCRHTRTNTKHIPANRNIKLQLVGFHPTSVVNRKVVSRLCDHSALNDRAGACHV